VLLTWCGCATQQPFRGFRIGEPVSLITSVPPLLQDARFSCGPTCVLAVAAYWEADISTFMTNMSGRMADDMNAEDLCRIVRVLGLQAFAFQGSIAELERQVVQGRPVLALIPSPRYEPAPNIAINHVPLSFIADLLSRNRAHWVIVIGYSPESIIVHDPRLGRMAVARWRFQHWWQRKRQTCIVIVPAKGD
jgi:predicted double-glycine peptidase